MNRPFQPQLPTARTRTPVWTRAVLASPRLLFWWLAPLIYAVYALLAPPFQNFDENQHLYRAWQISNFEWQTERRGTQTGGELPPGLIAATIKEIGATEPHQQRTVAVKSLSQIFAVSTPFGLDEAPVFTDFRGAAVYSPVGYLPQSAVIALSRSAGLSVEWTVRAGRLVNAALAVMMMGLALTLLPFGRWIMLVIALLPPTVATSSSFGQDGLLLGATFVLTSLGLKAAAERRWTTSSTLLAVPATFVAVLTKFVYLPLALLPLLPVPRAAEGSWKRLTVPLVISAAASMALIGWLIANAGSVAPFRSNMPGPAEQVAIIVGAPIDYLQLVGWTYAVSWSHLSIGLFTFGDSTLGPLIPAWLAGTFAIAAAMAAGEPARPLTRSVRSWMIALFLSVALMIATALFVSYKPDWIAIIPGMQGRYFLPVLPLLGIALMRRAEQPAKLALGAALLCLAASHIATIGAYLQAFYPL